MKPPFSTAVGWLDPATVLKTQVLKACRDGHHSVSWSPMSRVVLENVAKQHVKTQ